MTEKGLCRDCGETGEPGPPAGRCPACGSSRWIYHPELHRLTLAHIDCDAFYAAVEKRDRPELASRPVIVGGGRRGVVAAACYVARLSGVRSAMPMFKALAACPDAVVIRPDMAKYAAVGRHVRRLMAAVTPLVESVSIDEAFLDLAGTETLHGGSPARSCALLARRIERETGVTVSIGLSCNKLLAKLASDLDKPRGFAVIGRAEAAGFLAERPVGVLWGVGRALQARLAADGILTIGQLREADERTLVRRYGSIGHRLWHFARGIDDRRVEPDGPPKSLSAEITLERDSADPDFLRRALWPLSERVSARLKAQDLAARTVVLKLKTARFRLITRRHGLTVPTQLAETLYRTGLDLLAAESGSGPFRLIGLGTADLTGGAAADPPDLFDPARQRQKAVEAAMDAIRARLGPAAIVRGRRFTPKRSG